MFIVITMGSWIPVILSVSLWVIHQLKRVTNVIIHLLENTVLVDVTFVENKPHFSTTYLHGELHTLEDKELDFPPLELSRSSKSK